MSEAPAALVLSDEAKARFKDVADELTLFLATPEANRLREHMARLQELQDETHRLSVAFMEELKTNPELARGAEVMARFEGMFKAAAKRGLEDAAPGVVDSLNKGLTDIGSW